MIQHELLLRRRTLPQKKLHESKARFNVASWGRQSGKTTAGLDKMLYKPLQGRPFGIYWYVLQTYSAAEIAFHRYCQNFWRDRGLLGGQPNKSDLFVPLINGAVVHFKSGDNFENLRAETLDGCIIDELRQQNSALWPRVIRAMLAKHKGWCDFYSTPNGHDHFYDLYQFAIEHPDEWSIFHAPSIEAPWWDASEIESAKASMSEDEFAQEILAEFREIGKGKVYINHGLHNQRTENPFAIRGYLWSHYLPIIVGLDFNVASMRWLLMQHRAGDFYVGDEIAPMGYTNTEETVGVLIEKVRGHKPGVILIGDASGKSQKTSASGSTDYSIIMKALKEAGIPVHNYTPESNPLVKDRVNMVNSRLKSANGQVHLWYHPLNCKHLKRDFERVVWKEGAQGAIMEKSDSTLTHASDALGYPICHYSKEWKSSPGVLRVVPR